jgi:hypothetical protein
MLPFTSPSFDLLTTATQLEASNPKWKMGITWEPMCPETDGTYDPCTAVIDADGEAVPATDPAPKAETTERRIRGAVPFTAYSESDCSPVGQEWDTLGTRNQQSLIRSEARFVEDAFWTGTAGTSGAATVFPHLAADSEVQDGEDLLQPTATVVTEIPQTIEVGIGMLEAAMRECYPGVATLHVPIRLASLMAEAYLLTTRGSLAFTSSVGSKVVLGEYPGTAPDGTSTPGVTWVYATGEVFFQREPAPHTFRPVESFNRDVNTLSMIAERTYVIGWDCCLLAIPILNGEDITS